jgi:hypothetical protein
VNSNKLDNLVRSGNLASEPPDQREFDGLKNSARDRLADAHQRSLSLTSRFDLGYNPAHPLALAALRWHGYRTDKRYLVFQCIPHTLGLGPEIWRVLDLCHSRRNVAEYEGYFDIEEQLVMDLLVAADALLVGVEELGSIGRISD